MEWTWLQSIGYGLISGFSEFLPVSAEAHRILFQRLTGAGNESLIFQLTSHMAILLALIISCQTQLVKLKRERKLMSIPARKRKRQPDMNAVCDLRLLKAAVIPSLLGFLIYLLMQEQGQRMWLLALLMIVNGIVLYIPQFLPQGNKSSQSVSRLDGLLIGLAGSLGVIPGLSRIGAAASVGRMRGVDSDYILGVCLILSIPALAVLIAFDIYSIIALAVSFSFGMILKYLLTAVTAFIGAYFGIVLMRFLAVKVGFSGFAYYCWGGALFTFILYLTI